MILKTSKKFSFIIIYIELVVICTILTKDISTKRYVDAAYQILQKKKSDLNSLSTLFKGILLNLGADLKNEEYVRVRKYFTTLLDSRKPNEQPTFYWLLTANLQE